MDTQAFVEQLKARREALRKEQIEMEQQVNMLHANLNAYAGAISELDNLITQLAQQNDQGTSS